jgi:hypothetical protein
MGHEGQCGERGGNLGFGVICLVQNANINAGQLPDGSIYLASNPCPEGIRDPLVVSTRCDANAMLSLA